MDDHINNQEKKCVCMYKFDLLKKILVLLPVSLVIEREREKAKILKKINSADHHTLYMCVCV